MDGITSFFQRHRPVTFDGMVWASSKTRVTIETQLRHVFTTERSMLLTSTCPGVGKHLLLTIASSVYDVSFVYVDENYTLDTYHGLQDRPDVTTWMQQQQRSPKQVFVFEETVVRSGEASPLFKASLTRMQSLSWPVVYIITGKEACARTYRVLQKHSHIVHVHVRSPSINGVTKYLNFIARSINLVDVSQRAMYAISKLADGNVRHAMSIFHRVVTFTYGQPKRKRVTSDIVSKAYQTCYMDSFRDLQALRQSFFNNHTVNTRVIMDSHPRTIYSEWWHQYPKNNNDLNTVAQIADLFSFTDATFDEHNVAYHFVNCMFVPLH